MISIKAVLRRIKNLLTNSIRKKLILYVFIYIIVPVFLLYVYTFTYFNKILVENANESSLKIISSISANLNVIIDNMITTSKFISFDRNVINVLKNSNNKGYTDIDEAYAVGKLVLNIQVNYLNHYFQIDIVPIRGDVISTWSNDSSYQVSDYKEQTWYNELLSDAGKLLWVVPYSKSKYNIASDVPRSNHIMVATSALDNVLTNAIGVVTVSMDEKHLQKMLFSNIQYNYGNDEQIFIINNRGYVISSNIDKDKKADKNLQFMDFKNYVFNKESGSNIERLGGQDYLVNYLTLKNVDWKVVQVIPYNSLINSTQKLINNILVASFILLAVIIIILLVFTNSITSPINKLVRLMKKVEEGELNVEIKNKSNDEIYMLGKAFNNMISKQKSLISKITEEELKLVEIQKKEAEMKLEMLMAQINPHFLFNTLNVIKWTAIVNRADTVGTMISHLGNLLEMTINKKSDIISLTEEIDNVKSYLYIQKVRFDNRFDTVFSIPDDVKQCKVPKLILQPLVENSIIHGFNNKDNGEIQISAHRHDNELIIIIKDNGTGIDEQTIQNLMLHNINNTNKDRFSGIGVANVNERIRLYYGSNYGISLKSELGAGTEVKISLPYINRGEKND